MLEPRKTNRLAAPTLSEHVALMRWMRQNGLLPYVPFFNGGKISHEFVSVYALTPSETAELSQASRQAKAKLEEMSSRRAQLDPSSNEKKLIVTVPSFPEEGGEVYDALLGRISATLGPERYALFDETSGTALDQEFKGFGLARNRYEVLLTVTPGGSTAYQSTVSFVYDAINYRASNGSAAGTSSEYIVNNSMNAAGVIGSFPVLKSFPLPSVPSVAAGK